jgi:hypothetical protein
MVSRIPQSTKMVLVMRVNVKLSMKAYGGVDVQIHVFLTSALTGGEWSASRPGHFTPGKKKAAVPTG